MVYGSLCLQGSEKPASRKFPITQQFTYIGKDKDCDIRFESAKLDGKQFLLTALQAGRVKIQNLSKRFPTLVNEKEIGFQVDRDIKENDVITAGSRKIKWSYQNSPGKNAAKSETVKRRASEPAPRRVAVVNPCRREPVQEMEEPPPKRRRTAHQAGPPTPHHCRSESFVPTPSALARRVQYDKTLRASRVSPMTKNQVPSLKGSAQGATPKRVSFFHPPGTPNYQFNHPDLNNRSITPRTFYNRGLKSSTPYAFQGFNNITQDTPPSLLRDFSSYMTSSESTPRGKSCRVPTPYPDRTRSGSLRKSRNSKNRQSLVAYFETIEENDSHSRGPSGRHYLSALNEFSRDQTPASYFSPPPNGSPRMMRAESPQLSQQLLFNERPSLLSSNSQYGTPSKSLGRSSQFSSLYANPSSSQQGNSFSGNNYSHNFSWNSNSPRSTWDTFSATPPQLRTPRRSIIDETQGSASFSPMSCASLGPRSLSVGRDFRHNQLNLNSSRASFNFNTPPQRQIFDRNISKSLSVQVLSRAVKNKLSRGGMSPLTPGSRRQHFTNIKNTSRPQPSPLTKVKETTVEQTNEKTPPKRKSSVKTQPHSNGRKSSTPARTSSPALSSASDSAKKETLQPPRKSAAPLDDQAAPQIQTRTSMKNSQRQTRSSGGKTYFVAKQSLKGRRSGTLSPAKKHIISSSSPPPKSKKPVVSPNVTPGVSHGEDLEQVSKSPNASRPSSGSEKPRRSVSIGGNKNQRSSTKTASPGATQSGKRSATPLSTDNQLKQSGAELRRTRSRSNISLGSDVGRGSTSSSKGRKARESVLSPLNLSRLFNTSEPSISELPKSAATRASSGQSDSQPRRSKSSKSDVSVVAVKTGVRKSKLVSTSKNNSALQSSRKTSGQKLETSTPKVNQNVSVSSSLNLSTLFHSPAGDESNAVSQSSRGSLDASVQQTQSGSRRTRFSKSIPHFGQKPKGSPTQKNRSNVSIMSPLTALFQTPETSDVSDDIVSALQSSGKGTLELSYAKSRHTRSSLSVVSVSAVKTSVQKSKLGTGRRSISISPSPLAGLFQTPQAAQGEPPIITPSPLQVVTGRQSAPRKRFSTTSIEYPLSPLSALFQTPEVLSRSPRKSTPRSLTASDAAVVPSISGTTPGHRTPPTITITAPTPTGSTAGKSPQPSTPPNATPPQVLLLSSKKSSVRKGLLSSPETPSRAFRKNPSRSAKKQSSGKVVRQRINSSRSPKLSSVVKKLNLDPEKPDKNKMAVLKICHVRKSPISKGAQSILSEVGNARRSLDYSVNMVRPLPETSTLNHSLPNIRFGDPRKKQNGQDDAKEELGELVANRLEQASPKYELLNALYLSKAGSLNPQKPSRRLRSNLQSLLKTSSTPHTPTSPKKLQFKTPLVEFEGTSVREPSIRSTPLKSIVATSSSAASSTDAMNRMYTSSPAVSYTDSSGRKKTFRISPLSPSKGGSIKELIPEDELSMSEDTPQAGSSKSSPRKRKLPGGEKDGEPGSSKRTKGVTMTPVSRRAQSPKSSAVRQTRSARKMARVSPKKTTAPEQQPVETPSTVKSNKKVGKAARKPLRKIVVEESPKKSPKRQRTNSLSAGSDSPKSKKGKHQLSIPLKKEAAASKKSPLLKQVRGGRTAANSKSQSPKSVQKEKVVSPSPKKVKSGKAKAASPTPKKQKRGKAKEASPTPKKVKSGKAKVASPTPKKVKSGKAKAASPTPKKQKRGKAKVASPTPKKVKSGKAKGASPTPKKVKSGKANVSPLEAATPTKSRRVALKVQTKGGASPSKIAVSPKRTRRGALKSPTKAKASPSPKKARPKVQTKSKASPEGKSPASKNSSRGAAKAKTLSPKTTAVSKRGTPSPGSSHSAKSVGTKKKSPASKKEIQTKTSAKTKATKAVSVSPKRTRSNISKTRPEPKNAPKRKAAKSSVPKENSPSPRKLRRGGKKDTTLAKPHKASPAKNKKPLVSKPGKSIASKTSKRSPKELRVGKVVRSVRSKK